MPEIDKVLKMAAQAKASDVHIASGSPIMLRQHGKLLRIKGPEIKPETAKGLVYEIITPAQRKSLEEGLQLDFGYHIPEVARFRSSAVYQRLGINAAFRVIPERIPTLEELGLPPVVKKFCDFHQGMILVTGATGQGKSTTLAAIIDSINSTRPLHVLTVEDPIEFVHPLKVGIVNQRELNRHTMSFANALRAALRQDPDVIMVGELRDLESIELAATASETGHLVLATMSTSSGPKTVDRLIDSFPPDEQSQIRAMVSEGLRAVITQMLVPRKEGKGRVLASEIMIGSTALANLIRAGKTYQLPSLMQTGRAIGMQSMDDSLMDLYKADKISAEAAYYYCSSRKRFAPLVGKPSEGEEEAPAGEEQGEEKARAAQ